MAVAALLLIIPGVLNFVRGQGPHSLTFARDSCVVFNDLLSPLVPSSVYLVHTSATTALTSHFSDNFFEQDSYLSLPFIICFIVLAASSWRKLSTRMLTLTSVCIGILSLGPILHVGGADTRIIMPWILILPVPIGQDILPARLSLFVVYLAIILVISGVDDAIKEVPGQIHPLKIRPLQAAGLLLLGLTALLWLPRFPTYSTPLPLAAHILRSDLVVSRYIRHRPTLVLYSQMDEFNVVMGVLAASNNYDMVSSNVYGYSMLTTPSFQLNQAFVADTTGRQTNLALCQYLPELRVGEVMFISTDDIPINQVKMTRISQLLGATDYNRDGLVVVWTVPKNLAACVT